MPSWDIIPGPAGNPGPGDDRPAVQCCHDEPGSLARRGRQLAEMAEALDCAPQDADVANVRGFAWTGGGKRLLL